jgi:rhomboid protease GluP
LLSIYDRLIQRCPTTPVTNSIVVLNIGIFAAMVLLAGAGIWHSPNDVQLHWGANFGPATQDGEWWRLGTAMFLHFGVIHLCLNAVSLWEAGQLVERMYGRWRFIIIYLSAGLFGNLLSLVVQGNEAVSGGASGAIFGIYGAAIIFLWHERAYISAREFKWLFGGACVFSIITIILGFIIPGIDNAAHIGGLIAGAITSIVLIQPMAASPVHRVSRGLASVVLILACVSLAYNIPQPKYRWSDELLLRSEINAFLYENQAINRTWLEIAQESKQGNQTFEELASKIDFAISKPYQAQFDKLSKLPQDPSLPSAQQLEGILEYAEIRKNASEALVKGLREQPQRATIRKAD